MTAVGGLTVLKLVGVVQMYPLPAVMSSRHKLAQYSTRGWSPPMLTGAVLPLLLPSVMYCTGVVVVLALGKEVHGPGPYS